MVRGGGGGLGLQCRFCASTVMQKLPQGASEFLKQSKAAFAPATICTRDVLVGI